MILDVPISLHIKAPKPTASGEVKATGGAQADVLGENGRHTSITLATNPPRQRIPTRNVPTIMAHTNVQDIIVPELFLPYTIVRTMELSAFHQSGIVTADPQFTAFANDGGVTAHLPYFEDISGDEELIGRTGNATIDNITTAQDICVKILRQKAFGTRDIAGLLAGSDPMNAIANLVAAYWNRMDQARLLHLLKGVFSIASMADLIHDIALAGAGTPALTNLFTGKTFIDAKQKLGDAKEKLGAIAIHSAVEAWLSKQDLIDEIPDSKGEGRIKTFQGMRVIVDDGMPHETVSGNEKYTSYVFAQGAVAFAEATVDQAILGGIGSWRLEYSREALAGESAMIMRRRMIHHIRGIKWLGGSMAADTPTNAELESASNWLRVYEVKQMRVIKFVHNIG